MPQEAGSEGWAVTAQSSGVRGLSLRNDVTWGTYLSPVYQADFPFNAVGLAWTAETPPGSRIELEVRASPDGQDWSEWFEVEPLDGFSSETGEHRSQLIVAGGNFLQYRATLYATAEELVPVLSDVKITYIDSSQGPPTPRPQPVGALSQSAALNMPALVSRAGWGSPEPYSSDRWPPEYREWQKVAVHDTVTKNDDPNPAATVRAIWYYHANTLGWGDIGYNYLIDSYGNIYEGRFGGENAVGAHVLPCYNYGSMGVALLGDYRYAEVSPAMEGALISLLAAKSYQHNINPLGSGFFGELNLFNIFCHRDLYGSCGNNHMDPGTYAHERMPEFRGKVWDRFPMYNQVWGNHNTPQKMLAGSTASVAVTVTNKGRAAWSRSENYRLGYRWYRQDGAEVLQAGGGQQRAELPADVPFGQTVTINAQITAPASGGAYTLQWDMVQEGLTWFSWQGNPTLNATVSVDEPTYTAEWAAQSPGMVLFPGSTRYAWFELKNAGTATWYRTGSVPVKLGTWSPENRASALATPGDWESPSRASILDQEKVLPGQVGRFTFIVTGPSQPQVYREHFRLIAEGKNWFGPDMYLDFFAVRPIKTYLPEITQNYAGGW